MSYNFIKDDIKNKELKRVYIFHGNEEYLKYETLKATYKLFCGSSQREASYFEFDAREKLNVDEVIDCCDSLSLFGGNKLVIIRNLKSLLGKGEGENKNVDNDNAEDKLKDYLKYVPDSTCLIFYVELTQKDKENRKNIQKNSKIYKEIKKIYGEQAIIEFSAMNIQDLVKWIAREFKKNNLMIDRSACEYLIEIKDSKMGDIYSEIQKLSSYCLYKDAVTTADIDKLCNKSIEYQIFTLTDAISQKNTGVALNILNSMKEKKVAAQYIISMMNWQFKALLLFLALSNQGESRQGIMTKLKLRDFMYNKYVKLVKNFNEEKLANAIRDCQESDFRIKTLSVNAYNELEVIIVKYAGKF